MNTSKLLMTSDDNILFSKLNDNTVETTAVSYAGIDLAFFWILRTSMKFEDYFFLTDEIKPYVTVEFVFQNSNWYLDRPDWHKFKTIPAKMCKLEDICKFRECDKMQVKAFNAWDGFSMICPDLDVSDFEILGEPSSMKADKLILQMRKCNPATRLPTEPECAEPAVID